MRLKAFIEQTLTAATDQDLYGHLRAYVEPFSCDLVSYHMITRHMERLDFEQGFRFHCFPEVWVARYAAQNYFDIDPIIALATTMRQPFHWYDVGTLMRLTPVQTAYLEDMKAHGLVDGFAVPIFGPFGNVAYFGIGSTHCVLDLPQEDVLDIQYACNQVHKRFYELNRAEEPPRPKLSKRETEVLHWLARGKSNSVIGDILGISEHTVDTIVRRCYAKLGVSDRISAALKGVGQGHITM